MITDAVFHALLADVAETTDRLWRMADQNKSYQAQETAQALLDRMRDCLKQSRVASGAPECLFTMAVIDCTEEPEQLIGLAHADSWEELSARAGESVTGLRTKMSLQNDKALLKMRKHPDDRWRDLTVRITRGRAGEHSDEAAKLWARTKRKGNVGRPRRALLKGAPKPDLKQYDNKLAALKDLPSAFAEDHQD